jgi:hypothetical protein
MCAHFYRVIFQALSILQGQFDQLTHIKNISDIYYPINWNNFHNKTNYILVENEPTREINLNLVFQRFKKINYINIVMTTFLN